MTSKHWTEDRQKRQAIIDQIGEGHTVKEVVIDNGDPRGATIHKISDTGIITVVNQRTLKIVTKKIARVGQLIKLYNTEKVPNYLIALAREHQSLGYNMIQRSIKNFSILKKNKNHLTKEKENDIIKLQKKRKRGFQNERCCLHC